MAQIVEVFLARLNIPLEEVDTFTSQVFWGMRSYNHNSNNEYK